MNIVQKRISNNFTKGRNGNIVTGIVIHTEGVPLTSKIDSMDDRSLYAWFNNPTTKASSHFYVTFSGKIEQYVDEVDTAWHAVGDGNQNVQTIGIEHQDNGYWEKGKENRYTQAQYEASAQLVAYLAKKYNVPLKHAVAGIRPHNEIDPKACPGAFDWQRVIEMAKGVDTKPEVPDNTAAIKLLNEAQSKINEAIKLL